MRWSFATADAREAEWLRSAFIAYLRARGADDADYAGAELIFGELIGNVVRHAPGPIWIDVDWRRGKCPVLSVADRGPGFTLRPVLPEDLLAESGRGLFLVAIYGDDLTVEPNPGGGSRVSVTLKIPRRRDAAREIAVATSVLGDRRADRDDGGRPRAG